ncbi:hypothetical protein GO491_01745 [Flavobacteriaceae bacterium Ap0902]|nr:hypothetical protein [Flavobacteriaceae bacterium Ap0902]
MENQTINNNPQAMPPNNNMVWAILSTLFCCLPTGIYAIIKATEVNSKWNAGDYVGAAASADQAKKWSIYGAIAGGIVILLYILFFGSIMAAIGMDAANAGY